MMENIEIYVNKKTRKINLTKTKIGNDLENLQAKLVFNFEDEFVNGSARLEYEADYEKHYVLLDKEEETYTTPVKNFLTKAGQINMQLVIVEAEGEEGIPVFKSNGFFLNCGSSINANEEAPEEYEYWLDLIQEKIAEVENIDINATKEEHTATISITKKDGTQQEVEILDGEDGTDGQDAKINGYNTLNIVAGDNITIEQEEDTLTISSEGGSGGTGDYEDLENKPQINGHELVGNKTLNDLGIDQDFVKDNDYVHTDNNFTTAEKTKLSGLSNYDDTEVKQDIENLGIEIDNLDLNKVPKTRKINNKTLENDITLTPSDIGLGSVFTLKGNVATTENLPSTGNVVGDVYYVESEEVGYIWLEKQSVLQWEQLGLPIDLSNYYNKTQTDTLLSAKQENLVFNTAYNPTTNPVATMSDINNIVGDIANELGGI